MLTTSKLLLYSDATIWQVWVITPIAPRACFQAIGLWEAVNKRSFKSSYLYHKRRKILNFHPQRIQARIEQVHFAMFDEVSIVHFEMPFSASKKYWTLAKKSIQQHHAWPIDYWCFAMQIIWGLSKSQGVGKFRKYAKACHKAKQCFVNVQLMGIMLCWNKTTSLDDDYFSGTQKPSQ